LLSFISSLNFAIFVFFTIIYLYRVLYILVGLHSKHKKAEPAFIPKMHRYAAIIAARNEQGVIGELIKSIKNQGKTIPKQINPRNDGKAGSLKITVDEEINPKSAA